MIKRTANYVIAYRRWISGEVSYHNNLERRTVIVCIDCHYSQPYNHKRDFSIMSRSETGNDISRNHPKCASCKQVIK